MIDLELVLNSHGSFAGTREFFAHSYFFLIGKKKITHSSLFYRLLNNEHAYSAYGF